MEESQKQIQIRSYISPDLLLNVQNRPWSQSSYAYRSYFNTVEKFREKERELSESKKTKHTFVDKFYQKLKKELQNSSDSKKLKENLSLMNICLKHKHARYSSENLEEKRGQMKDKFATGAVSRVKRAGLQTKRKPLNEEPMKENVFQMKTRRIINSCKVENDDLTGVHKKIGLFNYYTKKMEQKFEESERRIKKTVREF